MHSTRRWINQSVMLAPILILGVGTFIRVRSAAEYLVARKQLSAILSAEITQSLGRDVWFRNVRLFGNPWNENQENRLEISDVFVANGPLPSNGSFFTASKVSVRYILKNVITNKLFDRPLFEEMKLESPHLFLTRDATGHWNYEQLLKPKKGRQRPISGKIVFTNAILDFQDNHFPSPKGVPARAFYTKLSSIHGVALIRSDNSISFDIRGIGQPKIIQNFHTTGTITPSPMQINARLVAEKANLPVISGLFFTPESLKIKSGIGDIDAGLSYIPVKQNGPFEPNSLHVDGAVKVLNVTAAGKMIYAPLENLNGTVTFTNDSILAKLDGKYDAMPIHIDGSVLGFRLPSGSAASSPSDPIISIKGTLQNADFRRLRQIAPLAAQIAKLSKDIRADIESAEGNGSIQYQIEGTGSNPNAILIGHFPILQYAKYHAENVDLSAFLLNHQLRADVKGRYAGGNAIVRANATFDPKKNNSLASCLIEAHGASIHPNQLGLPILQTQENRIEGSGKVDITMQWDAAKPFSITSQADLQNVAFRGQAIHSLYVYLEKVEQRLIFREIRAEDEKGFALGRGTYDLEKKSFDIDINGDELDLGLITKSLIHPNDVSLQKKTIKAPSSGFDPASLKGYGYLRNGKITGNVDDPQLNGNLLAFSVSLDRDASNKPIEMDKVTAIVAINQKKATIQAVGTRYPGTLTLNGNIYQPFSVKPELELTAEVHGLDMPTWLQTAGVDTGKNVVTGTLTTDAIEIQGAPDSLQFPTPFTVTLNDASLNGLPITNATLKARYQTEGLEIDSAFAQLAGGSVSAKGRIPKDGQIQLKLRADELNLQPILQAFPGVISTENATHDGKSEALLSQLALLNGSISLDADVSGTTDNPVALVTQLNGKNLAYNNFSIGILAPSSDKPDWVIRYDRKSVTLQKMTISGAVPGDGLIILPKLVYDTETKRFQMSDRERIRLEDIPASRIRDLAYNLIDLNNEAALNELKTFPLISGPLRASIGIGGALENPQLEVTWNAPVGIKIADYSINTFSGSATLDKDRLIYPARIPDFAVLGQNQSDARLRLESDDAVIVTPDDSKIKAIIVEYSKPNVEGHLDVELKPEFANSKDIKPDLSASNIKLEFLQKFPTIRRFLSQDSNQNLAKSISGTGDIGIQASGKTMSPLLEVSVNLRKVEYKASPNSVPLSFEHIDLNHATIQEGRIQVDSFQVKTKDTASNTVYTAEADGFVTGFTWKDPFLLDSAVLQLNTKPIPLEFIAALAPNILQHSKGTLTLTAKASGLRLKSPDISGSIVINSPHLQLAHIATGLQDVLGEIQIQGNRLIVSSFSGHSQVYDHNGQSIPKQRGADIVLTGSLPLGLSENSIPDQNGIHLRVGELSQAELNNTTTKKVKSAGGTEIDYKKGFYFRENPLPGGKTGSANGWAWVDLRVVGTVKEPKLVGKAHLLDTVITPPSDENSNPVAFPILPNFDLALQLGSNVRLVTPQLDVHLRTDKDIRAIGTITTGLNDKPQINASLDATARIESGVFKLPTSRFTIQPDTSSVRLIYPYDDPNSVEPILGVLIDISAQGHLTATSLSGFRERYTITLHAKGPVTGNSVDPQSGKSPLSLDFQTSPDDLGRSQLEIQQKLAYGLVGANSVEDIVRNPGQTVTNVLYNAVSDSLLPGIFDKFASDLGFEELALGYNPVERFTLSVSRRLFGRLYVGYHRSFNPEHERYNFSLSLRLKKRFQLSYKYDEQQTHKLLLEGVWKF